MPARAVASSQKVHVRVTNSRTTSTSFVLEPWGEIYDMPAEAVFELDAVGPSGDSIEVVVEEDAIVVWGWPGSVVRVSQGGVELGSGQGRPSVPGADRLSVAISDFVDESPLQSHGSDG